MISIKSIKRGRGLVVGDLESHGPASTAQETAWMEMDVPVRYWERRVHGCNGWPCHVSGGDESDDLTTLDWPGQISSAARERRLSMYIVHGNKSKSCPR